MKKTDCPECGCAEHYVHTAKRANRFGITGRVVKAVECTNCGNKHKV